MKCLQFEPDPRNEIRGWWLLQLKEAGWMSKGARKALLVVGRAFMADGKV